MPAGVYPEKKQHGSTLAVYCGLKEYTTTTLPKLALPAPFSKGVKLLGKKLDNNPHLA
jgi:hypothetical protein